MLNNLKQPKLNGFFALYLFLLALLPSSPAQASHDHTIAYIGFSTDKPFWVKLGKAIQQGANDRGISLIDLTPPTPDPELQVKFLNHAIKKQVDGIIIGANTPHSLSMSLDMALKNEIPIVAVDTMIAHPAIKSLIATDNDAGADLAGQYIVQKTGGKGTVMILGGTENHPNAVARRDGVTRHAEKAGMKVLFRRTDWDDEKAFLATAEELRKPNDISAIFACWDPGIDTASHVAREMRLGKNIVLVGFDGLDRTINYIRQGKVTATIAQDTDSMGEKSIETIERIIVGTDVANKFLIPPYLIDYQYLSQDTRP